jgi:hypothetical protein
MSFGREDDIVTARGHNPPQGRAGACSIDVGHPCLAQLRRTLDQPVSTSHHLHQAPPSGASCTAARQGFDVQADGRRPPQPGPA